MGRPQEWGPSLGCHHPGQLGRFPKTFGARRPSLLDVSPALSGASRNIQVCPVPCHSSWELGALMSFLILFLFTLPPPALLAQGLLSCEMRNSLLHGRQTIPRTVSSLSHYCISSEWWSDSRSHSANTRPDRLNSDVAGKITKEEWGRAYKVVWRRDRRQLGPSPHGCWDCRLPTQAASLKNRTCVILTSAR